MLENKKSVPARELNILSNNGNIQKLQIGKENLKIDVVLHPSPTSNCQISSINNINKLIDTLTIEELTNYTTNLITPGNYLKLIIIRNTSRFNKFKESFKKVSNKTMYVEQTVKVRGINQYIILLKRK
jgi:hypothetical protein